MAENKVGVALQCHIPPHPTVTVLKKKPPFHFVLHNITGESGFGQNMGGKGEKIYYALRVGVVQKTQAKLPLLYSSQLLQSWVSTYQH